MIIGKEKMGGNGRRGISRDIRTAIDWRA